MFAKAKLSEHPKYITTAGFGCIFSNYGLGPGTPEEPTIITKFFGKNSNNDESDAYYDEKESHRNVIEKCGKFETMNSIFGVDLNSEKHTSVEGYKEAINVKGKPYKHILTGKTVIPITKLSMKPEFRDVSPSLVCETPNYKEISLRNPVFGIDDGHSMLYPVIKMNNLGMELFDDPSNLTVNSFIQMLELLALLHTGMIHNDIKGNNMLVSPLTGKVSLIDFGLCKPFDPASPAPPYNERTYPSIRQVWYAYPPEYTFLRSSRTEFRDPELSADYVEQFIDQYEQIKKHHNWPFHPFMDVIDEHGETTEQRVLRVRAALKKVYDEYFKPDIPNRLSNPHIFLQTAVTGDTYTVGLESFYYYSRVHRADNLPENPAVPATMVRVDKGKEVNGEEFIDAISVLLTAFNPRYRPFHINIIKLYRFYNKSLIEGATTTVNVKGSPYMELSILNGSPLTIDVEPGMALGMEGCPIPKEEVDNNLKLLYYFLQHDINTIVSLIYGDVNTYESLLDAANKMITEKSPALFLAGLPNSPAIPSAPAPSPASSPLPPTVPLTGPPTVQPTVQPTGPLEERTEETNLVSVSIKPSEPEFQSAQSVPTPPLPDHTKVPTGQLFSRNFHRGGGDANTLSIHTGDKRALVKNLIEAGLLAPGVYMSALNKSSDSEISDKVIKMLRAKQSGGLNNTQFNSEKINNKQTKKLNRGSNNKNGTRRNKAKVEMPSYSELQTNVFINNIGTSTTPGKINILHAYYISYLPVEDQKKITKLLFFVPLADPDIIRNVINLLSSQSTDKLVNYLNGLKSAHVSEVANHMPLDIMKGGGADIDSLVESYVNDNDEDRYRSLLSTFREMSRQIVKANS